MNESITGVVGRFTYNDGVEMYLSYPKRPVGSRLLSTTKVSCYDTNDDDDGKNHHNILSLLMMLRWWWPSLGGCERTFVSRSSKTIVMIASWFVPECRYILLLLLDEQSLDRFGIVKWCSHVFVVELLSLVTCPVCISTVHCALLLVERRSN